jgi:nucleotide-binding universal stress UspA family protein
MKILLATDGSDDANAAVDFLLQFPFPEQCTITLLTVIDAHLFVDVEAVELSAEQHEALHLTKNSVREEAHQYLASQADRVARDGWTVTTRVRTGDVAEEIILAAEELGADLAIVGSHGLSAYRHFLLGSVATKVLGYAPCSVLIVKEPAGVAVAGSGSTPATGDWRVLLAYDDSEPARKAVSLCASLPFGRQDEIVVVTVLALVTAFRQDIRQHMNPIWQQKKIATRAALDSAVATLRDSTPRVSSRMREGANSAHEIIEAASEADSNLIMLGWKGKQAMQRFLLGSMTGHVARYAPCSVWVVRD